MDDARIKPGIWVKAQLRLCDLAGVTFTVLRRGDGDGGSVLLKIINADGLADVLSQVTGPNGGLAWMRPLGQERVDEGEADSYLARQGDFDPDIWVLEVIDRAGAYVIDGPVLDGY